VKKRFQNVPFKFNLRRYSAALADRIRGEEVWKLLGAKMETFSSAAR
jgi:hypothetical protein